MTGGIKGSGASWGFRGTPRGIRGAAETADRAEELRLKLTRSDNERV